MLKPGRAMNGMIHKHVMGHDEIDVFDIVAHLGGTGDRLWASKYCQWPDYSTDDAAAWTVVQAMWGKGYLAMVYPKSERARFGIGFNDFNGNGVRYAKSDTFAHAVCIAALRALGVEVDE